LEWKAASSSSEISVNGERISLGRDIGEDRVFGCKVSRDKAGTNLLVRK
jgi:hypothetical protein